jgi:tryptophan synthase beta chain
MDDLWTHYVGRPSPLYFAERLTEHLGGAKVYMKRDELNHTGAHKINNVLGQIILARRMGKTRIIAETGAGQHGVATATVCAKFGLKCVVYMGAHDVERQAPNVFRMKLLGAEVVPVTSGRGTLKDAMNDALRDWVTNVRDTFYCIGTVAGPHPYPAMVRDFQAIIGKETKAQMHEPPRAGCPTRSSPPSAAARTRWGCSIRSSTIHRCASSGSRPAARASTTEDGALRQPDRRAPGRAARQPHLSAAGRRRPDPRRAFDLGRARLSRHRPRTRLAARDRRAEYVAITDAEALEAFQLCCALEGIIPALEPSHALAHVMKIAPDLPRDHLIVMNMCGRGDKDIFTVAKHLGFDMKI